MPRFSNADYLKVFMLSYAVYWKVLGTLMLTSVGWQHSVVITIGVCSSALLLTVGVYTISAIASIGGCPGLFVVSSAESWR